LLLSIGRFAAVIGALIAVLAGVARITSGHFLGNFEVGTLFLLGTTVMVFACVCFLAVLTSSAPARR
jgi:hypothetical protein